MRFAADLAQDGSSPREWGTQQFGMTQTGISRFIPTRVGNTALLPRCLAGNAVHPHASGEHARPNFKLMNNGGSSPREWGTRVLTIWA